ncbi:MAG: 23S rRNA (pseudouridine(1915)-N(3))-methyltransferase RlmH [Bacillota bacterium]|jgi:23S rRNA (pseudouridine1915-N3)-methyltransferase
MQISILCIGKLKENYLKEGVAEYLKRLGPLAKLKIYELNEEKSPANPSLNQTEQIKEAEGRRILDALPKDCYHMALDMRGKNLSSQQLAQHFHELALRGQSHLAFSIGGSYGLAKNVIDEADFVLSFGNMTYPHQLMRLILLEQIYRAFKISLGHTYHK